MDEPRYSHDRRGNSEQFIGPCGDYDVYRCRANGNLLSLIIRRGNHRTEPQFLMELRLKRENPESSWKYRNTTVLLNSFDFGEYTQRAIANNAHRMFTALVKSGGHVDSTPKLGDALDRLQVT